MAGMVTGAPRERIGPRSKLDCRPRPPHGQRGPDPMAEVIVLCYHAVSREWDADLSVTPEAFERQVGHLVSRGWRATTFTDAVLNRGPGRLLAITFDDAFASVKRHAAPVLARHGIPATVFAPTAFMDGGGDLDWPGVDHWKQSAFAGELAAMDWSDLRALDAGRVGDRITHLHPSEVDDAGRCATAGGARPLSEALRAGARAPVPVDRLSLRGRRRARGRCGGGRRVRSRRQARLRPAPRGRAAVPARRDLPPRRLAALPAQGGGAGPAAAPVGAVAGTLMPLALSSRSYSVDTAPTMASRENSSR